MTKYKEVGKDRFGFTIVEEITDTSEDARAYYAENPDIHREHVEEGRQSYLDDLMSKGMTEEDALEYMLAHPY
jgi:hypothetical protein